jgi:hypothetical protein
LLIRQSPRQYAKLQAAQRVAEQLCRPGEEGKLEGLKAAQRLLDEYDLGGGEENRFYLRDVLEAAGRITATGRSPLAPFRDHKAGQPPELPLPPYPPAWREHTEMALQVQAAPADGLDLNNQPWERLREATVDDLLRIRSRFVNHAHELWPDSAERAAQDYTGDCLSEYRGADLIEKLVEMTNGILPQVRKATEEAQLYAAGMVEKQARRKPEKARK